MPTGPRSFAGWVAAPSPMGSQRVRMAPMFQIQESRRSLAPDVGQAGQLARTGGSLIGDRLRQFLKSKTFLGGLSDAALDALIRRGHVKKYVAGEVICRRQEQGDSLMIIIRGLIKIANDPDGKEIVLNFLERATPMERWRCLAARHARPTPSLWRRQKCSLFTRETSCPCWLRIRKLCSK